MYGLLKLEQHSFTMWPTAGHLSLNLNFPIYKKGLINLLTK
jgi:hypothetical protein